MNYFIGLVKNNRNTFIIVFPSDGWSQQEMNHKIEALKFRRVKEVTLGLFCPEDFTPRASWNKHPIYFSKRGKVQYAL